MQLINALPKPEDEVTTQGMCACMHSFNNHPATIILFSAVAPTVPSGLKSGGGSTPLTVTITNNKRDTIYYWWVNYSGNTVLYGSIAPGATIRQPTYSTHPWIVAANNGDLITQVTLHTSNMIVVVE